MSVYPELDNLDLKELSKRFNEEDPDQDSPGYAREEGIYYEEVARSILAKGDPGYRYLLAQVDHADTPRLRGILAALGAAKQHRQELEPFLVSFLGDQRALIVAEAIEALRDLTVGRVAEKVLPLAGHQSPYVRSSVLRYISHLGGRSSSEKLIAALADPHPVVRQTAVDELGELGIVEALPKLTDLLEHDSDPDVREAARTAVEWITKSS